MRRVLVTGANKGIGLAIVSQILTDEEDVFVLLGSRNRERGESAVAGLVGEKADWAERIKALELDVSNDDSVAGAAKEVEELFGPSCLYAVVNNAGVAEGELRSVLQVNTLGIKRVCEAFLPLLDASSGRIVNITSAAGPNFVSACSPERQRFFLDSDITWSQLQSFMDECMAVTGGEDGFRAAGLGDGQTYGLSKACANSYTLLLARENPGLRINACTPGFIETDMTRPWAESRGKAPTDMGMKPPAEGTKSALFLLFGKLQGNGRYYGSDAKRSPLDRYRAPGDPEYIGD